MSGKRVIEEKARETTVFRECDVLVVGGGPAGTAAAASAAALGARTILLERYGYLGGMSTGGFVLWIDRMSDWEGRKVVGGAADELLGRLPPDAILGPPPELWGARAPEAVAHWRVRHAAVHGVVTWAPTIDPEWLKLASFRLLQERNVELLLHCWAATAVTGDGGVRGVVFESKAGRMAVLAPVVVDASGDGDIFASAGAAFESDVAKGTWHDTMNLGFRWAGVDTDRFLASLGSGELTEVMARAAEEGIRDLPYVFPRPGVVFFMAPKLTGYDCLKVEDLTAVEIESRRLMLQLLEFYRAQVPGFREAWIVDTAPQMGVRHSRRLRGVEKVLREDWMAGVQHADEVGLCPPPAPGPPSISLPLGCLVPAEVDGVVAAGRCLSCDPLSHVHIREIPICWVTGQAAGVVAALAADSGIQVRSVAARDVQLRLLEQGAVLRMASPGCG